ncbi:hypothetical protein B0H34DRAFT_659651 [Crassisporium funariophilum]|nr:hypothetical protein B0H34DRAFT_659651 [Crassisporium funariophilum]
MHIFINLSELIIPLWRGTLKCEATDNILTWDWATLTGDVWQAHGKLVAAATLYFPSSFHRPPRNPAEKISSGYKATEYFHYLFGLGPGFFRAVLPRKYWRNFCKLVRGIRIIIQRRITGSQMREAHSYLVQFVKEYENLYYQRRMDRLHFCRPCLHTLIHTCPEISRVGPGTYLTQYTMERQIGDLGQQVRQPSNPFANLCQVALRRSQINALKSMCPKLDTTSNVPLPAYSHDNGDGYIFLVPRQKRPMKLQGPEMVIMEAEFERSIIRKWGRLCLPNGQVARSIFSEGRRLSPNTRITRNLKLSLDGKVEFGEAQFYFQLVDPNDDDKFIPYALVSIYGPPDEDMLEDSCRTLWACAHTGSEGFRIIPVSSIISVVSMQPLPQCPGDPDKLWFVVEKPGLDDTELSGYVDPLL